MIEKVTVTGSFYDVSQRPLTGTVTFEASPEYIVHRPDDAVYTGKVTATLDADGRINTELIATQGWTYLVTFNLRTKDGRAVKMEPAHADFSTSGALPDFLEVNVAPGSTAPTLIFEPGTDPYTLNATGATIDPQDPGAILVPTENA